MAASTRSRVAGRTLSRPIDTRDTVWVETPASSATSARDGPLPSTAPPSSCCVSVGRLTPRKLTSTLVLVTMLTSTRRHADPHREGAISRDRARIATGRAQDRETDAAALPLDRL